MTNRKESGIIPTMVDRADRVPYGVAVEHFKEMDNDLEYHLKTCIECRMAKPCPLGRELIESYNFAVLAVRVYENGDEETALPRL